MAIAEVQFVYMYFIVLYVWQEGELQATIVQVQTELETQRQLAEGAKVWGEPIMFRVMSVWDVWGEGP